MEGAQEIVQAMNIVANVGGRTMDIAFKAGGALSKTALKVLALLGKGILFGGENIVDARYQNKKLISMSTMVKKKGSDLNYIRIPEDKANEFIKAVHKRGGNMVLLKDLNLGDGKIEFAYHVTDSAKIAQVMKDLQYGEQIGLEDYINNANEQDVNKIFEEVKQQSTEKEPPKAGKVKNADGPDKRAGTANDLLNDNKQQKMKKEHEVISVNKESLIKSEDTLGYIIRIPGTTGKDYMYVSKEQVLKEIDDGKTMIIKLKKEEEYNIFDKNGASGQKRSGSEIKKNFDNVKRKWNQASKTKVQTKVQTPKMARK